MQWQPIETAPKPTTNDEPILTDEGYAFWVEYGRDGAYYSKHDDSDYGRERLSPKWWIELPPVPSP